MVSINLMYYSLICILCSCGNNRVHDAPLILSDKKSMITKEEVLKSLDEHGKFHMNEFFPDLNDELMYLGGVKMNVYGDGRRWAIAFEKFGFNNRNWSIDHHSYYFGNCLQNMEEERENGRRVWCNIKVTQVVTPEEVSDLCEYLYFLKPGIDSIMINNQTFAIEQDVKKLKKMGIEIMKTENPKNLIDFVALMRYLAEGDKESFLCAENELRQYLPHDLPKIMTINEWYHRDYSYIHHIKDYDGLAPSSYETYQLIADVIVSQDSSKYKPTLRPNTHWTFWKESGSF